MAIKAGQILHQAGIGPGYIIDRIQTGGVSNLNIPEEKIYELGNYQTVAVVRDIPDLSFDLESFDVSTEIEAALLGKNPTGVLTGEELDFNKSIPMDVISPFKDAGGSFTTIRGVAVPYLTLETLEYRFGVGQNSSQKATLKGDGVYYVSGTPYTQEFSIITGANQTYTLNNTALQFANAGNTIYILGACAKNTTTGVYKRLFFGTDFTNTSTTLTTLADLGAAGYLKLHVVYGSATTTTYPQSVHETTAVKPAAIRAKDIDVYISDGASTPTLVRWKGVQNFDVSRKVALQVDKEFGNYQVVAQDYDVPDVSGTIAVRPADAQYMFQLIQQVANVSSTQIAGALTSNPLAMELRINNPDTGTRIKTLYVPDARIEIPSYSGKVQTKLDVTFKFQSDGGTLKAYKGIRPGSS